MIDAGAENDMTEMIQNYLKEIEELRAKLVLSESVCQQLRRNLARGGGGGRTSLSASPSAADINGGVNTLLAQARRDLQRDMEALARGKEALSTNDNRKNEAHDDSEHSETDDGGKYSL